MRGSPKRANASFGGSRGCLSLQVTWRSFGESITKSTRGGNCFQQFSAGCFYIIDNRYTIRFFQFDGKGYLRLEKDDEAFLPNDRYELRDKEFRLYYTSLGDKSHAFEVVIENSFGRAKTLEFRMNAKSEE